MIDISFSAGGEYKKVRAGQGETILAAVRRAGILLEAPCNGNGTCGKCRVRIRRADRDEILLACQTLVSDAMQVELLEQHNGNTLQIKQDGQEFQVHVASPVTKRYVATRHCTEVWYDEERIDTESGNTVSQLYGLAVDIGTTTLVVSLMDLHQGRELATAGALNPQSRFGQDVVSRIKYSSTAAGLATMHKILIDELNRLIQEIAEQAHVSVRSIYDIVLSGNTCMLHLLAEADPTSLGAYPYTPGIRGNIVLSARRLGIRAAGCARAYLPPIISAYVGADISAGIFVADLARQPGRVLLIDIGTNGEMVLADRGRMVATSTAAGPAFEGMNITCGMRAEPGAVEQFCIAENGEKHVKTIGRKPAAGICGSGLLDIVAALVQQRLVGKSGRFNGRAGENGLVPFEGKIGYEIANGVVLSQKDVRQVQLAKGAVRSGIETLLNYSGIEAGSVDRVLIAGSFGYHLNPASLLAIGLLPAAFEGRIFFLGNTAKTGSQAFLLNREARNQIAATVAGVATVELATVKDFDKLFIRCLEF